MVQNLGFRVLGFRVSLGFRAKGSLGFRDRRTFSLGCRGTC